MNVWPNASITGRRQPSPEGWPTLSGVQEGPNVSAHKFAVGQTVRFSPDRTQDGSGGRGTFKIIRLLPEAASVFQYRVKSQLDGHERVVREDQLARS